VRRGHFERLRPICPTCRAAGRNAQPLELAHVARAQGDDVLEGILLCPDQACQREHPIIDGIAVVVADLQSWVEHQMDNVLERHDLSETVESLLGDAAGPRAVFNRERSSLSSYAVSHWGDKDLGNPPAPVPTEAHHATLVHAALDLLPSAPRGVWVDLGCSVGRATFELAQRTGDLAIGVDLNFRMLRLAEQVRREQRATYPMRREGLVFDRRAVQVANLPFDRVSFWCADVGLLPFADTQFDGALSLNLLDCVPSPLMHLLEMGRVLHVGAPALLSTPFDWTPEATPLAQWLGGHSQRAADRGSSAARLRRLLAPGGDTGLDSRLVVRDESRQLPWRVYIHARASLAYTLDLLRLERV
jgi:SAM-dependent methyltransferase/uncharacterized protein YbaR (Trm112 family)